MRFEDKIFKGMELFSSIGITLKDTLEFRHLTQKRKEKLTV